MDTIVDSWSGLWLHVFYIPAHPQYETHSSCGNKKGFKRMKALRYVAVVAVVAVVVMGTTDAFLCV
jgi:hypothetical protein